jgi:hypothetical protein
MSECELVSESIRCLREDCSVAGRVQWRTAPQQPGLPHAERVCRNLQILSCDWLRKPRQVRLTPDLKVADQFLQGNHACLNQADLDLGSSGPLVVQSLAPERSPDFLVGGGKEGNLYLFNSLSLGTPLSEIVATAPPEWFGLACHAFVKTGGSDTHHIHAGPALWDVNGDGSTRLLYLMGENDNLKAFQITLNNQLVKIAWSKFRAFVGMPGGSISVSYSTDPSTALVWASVPVADANENIVRGMLIAFQATPKGTDIPLLWHSEMVPTRDSVGLYSKFTPPTIADSRVFVASFGDPHFVDSTGNHNEDWLRPGAINMYGFLNEPFRGRRRLFPGINKISAPRRNIQSSKNMHQ